jgi:Tfp pilus assembly protein PilF
MPLTINGIGTKYYGKRSLRTHPGTCESCRKPVQLADYETTLYFVVIYLPLIPLGRKQLLNVCPVCRRHAVLSARKWQEIKQSSIEMSTAALASRMDSAEAGLEHLNTLAGFGELEEARDLAEALEQQYATAANVQYALGAWHERYGHKPDADRCFRSSFKLDPANPATIRAHGLTLLEQGQLDEARQLLNQLQPPHPGFDPAIFSTLGRAFQDRQRYAESLELFGIAAQAPGMRENKTFQQLVRKSERSSGQRTGLVPPIRLWQRKGLRFAAILGTLAALWLLATWYRGGHRTLNIINGSTQQLIVQIDGGPRVSVFPQSHVPVSIAEGLHRVKILQPTEAAAEKSFLVQTPLWQRAFVSPSCTLDPLESAFVYWRKVWYHEQPDDSKDELDTHFGQLYLQYPEVNFQFVGFPKEVSLRNGRPEARTGLQFEPLTVAMLEDSGLEGESLLRRAEQLLPLRGFELSDGLAYFYLCQAANQEDRALGVFKQALQRRPAAVGIHRLYQNLCDREEEKAEELNQFYDEQVQAEPTNADLLYLRSCLESKYSLAGPFLDRAIAVAPEHAESWMRIGYGMFSSSRFAEVQKLQSEKQSLLQDWELNDEILFATRSYSQLFTRFSQREPDLEAFLEVRRLYHCTGRDFYSRPKDFGERSVYFRLAGKPWGEEDSRPGEGNGGLAQAARLRLEPGENWTLQVYSAFLERNREQLKQLLGNVHPQIEDPSYWKFLYELEYGSLIALAKIVDDWEDEVEAEVELLVALRLWLEDEAEQAESWLSSAQKRLAGEGRNGRAWSELLGRCRTEVVTAAEIRDLLEMPPLKAIHAAVIAAFAPIPDPEVIELARLYNYDLSSPHQLIERVLNKASGVDPGQ